MSDLLALAQELVAIPSVSLQEAQIADFVEGFARGAPWLEVDRIGDNVVARTHGALPVRVLLAGHLDTVPPPSRRGAEGGPESAPGDNQVTGTDGGTLWGLGSTDMKGGLAVMLDLAASLRAPNCDLTYVFYVAEEIARAHSGLLALAESHPDLLDADTAIVCEPTNCLVEAGCQGVLRAEIVLRGARAHVARPWTGSNAVHRLGPLLGLISSVPPRKVQIDGCSYQESLQAVRTWGGVAANVLPEVAGIEVNYRFAPDRDKEAARAALREMVASVLEEGDALVFTDAAPAALPSLQDPVLARLLQLTGHPPAGKLGWTDVAFFSERGTPAANFGPGDPELAHAPGERVTRAELERARAVLGSLLGEGG
ncbi:MAG TPA: succinyl-diaminopimelate desuccinylase [Acidimicrobiales bacterium]|nr:succinyl-diaminopimelate desuccinylase [Acidimicrobiales bacterium]